MFATQNKLGYVRARYRLIMCAAGLLMRRLTVSRSRAATAWVYVEIYSHFKWPIKAIKKGNKQA